jgi:hypothetical protein
MVVARRDLRMSIVAPFAAISAAGTSRAGRVVSVPLPPRFLEVELWTFCGAA